MATEVPSADDSLKDESGTTESRKAVAGGLKKASETLYHNADLLPDAGKVSGVAHATAEKLGATADYVGEHDVNSVVAGVKSFVSKNPGKAILAAGVVGFLAGRAFSSND